MMEINILAFGQIAGVIGKDSLRFAYAADTNILNEMLQEAYPPLRSLPYQIAINRKIMPAGSPLNAGDTVALLPPFSGG